MLKKMLKHEWAETWRIPSLAFFVTVVLTVVCALYFYFAPMATPEVELNVGNMVLFLLFVFYSGIVSLLITVYLGVRFYKNLYTDEGYLMHTLPVRPRMLILSKTLVGVFWIYLAGILSIITILPVVCLAVPKLGYISEPELAELTSKMLPELLSLFGDSPLELFFYFVPYMIVSSFFSVLLLYAAICLGQLFGKHKALSSILCYLGLNTLLSTVSAVLMVPGLTGVIITHADDSDDFLTLVMPSIMQTTFFITFLSSLLLSAVCFWLCDYLMKKNLNLD